MPITRVAVLGTGVLGSQIAFQTAFHGFAVTAYDLTEEALAGARKVMGWMAHHLRDEQGASDFALAEAEVRLVLTRDLATALRGADLVIESVPEQLELKRNLYRQIGQMAGAETIFVTNSSTLLPSDLAGATGRPERFLALHFANEIWRHNLAEIMPHPGTDPAIQARVVAFARSIGMIPVEIHKENPGYILNALLVPFLLSAGRLVVEGIASPEDIDRSWTIATGAPKGPLQFCDLVGLNTVYHIAAQGDENARAFARHVKQNYLDRGLMGRASGEGFYRYD